MPSMALKFVAAVIATSGCEAYVEPPAVGYVEVTSLPVDVEAAPSAYYEGRPVYYVNGRWWFREGPRWGYYRSEPEYLSRQRGYVQQAPRAPRERRERVEAPRR